MNTKQCCALATRCNQLLVVVLDNIDSLQSGKIKGAADEFLAVTSRITDFVQDVLKQGWFKKMLNWKDTSDELADLEKDLNNVQSALEFATNLGVFNILNETKEDQMKLQVTVNF